VNKQYPGYVAYVSIAHGRWRQCAPRLIHFSHHLHHTSYCACWVAFEYKYKFLNVWWSNRRCDSPDTFIKSARFAIYGKQFSSCGMDCWHWLC